MSKSVNWKSKWRSYLKLIIVGILEPVLFHPIITVCSVHGYINFLRKKGKKWKSIKRTGVRKRTKDRTVENVEIKNA